MIRAFWVFPSFIPPNSILVVGVVTSACPGVGDAAFTAAPARLAVLIVRVVTRIASVVILANLLLVFIIFSPSNLISNILGRVSFLLCRPRRRRYFRMHFRSPRVFVGNRRGTDDQF